VCCLGFPLRSVTHPLVLDNTSLCRPVSVPVDVPALVTVDGHGSTLQSAFPHTIPISQLTHVLWLCCCVLPAGDLRTLKEVALNRLRRTVIWTGKDIAAAMAAAPTDEEWSLAEVPDAVQQIRMCLVSHPLALQPSACCGSICMCT